MRFQKPLLSILLLPALIAFSNCSTDSPTAPDPTRSDGSNFADVTPVTAAFTTELLEETVIRADLQFRAAGATLYTRLGDWVAFVALAGAAAGIFTPGPGRPEGGLRGRRRP